MLSYFSRKKGGDRPPLQPAKKKGYKKTQSSMETRDYILSPFSKKGSDQGKEEFTSLCLKEEETGGKWSRKIE